MLDDLNAWAGLGDTGRISRNAIMVIILAAMGGGGAVGAVLDPDTPVIGTDFLLLESGSPDALLLESGGSDKLLLQY